MQKRSGITVAGSTIVDKIYEIPTYPALGELTQIRSISPAVGGCVANVSMDLKIDRITSRILHIGYFLLLKKVDAGEGLQILMQASAAGIETSIDLVSESSGRYGIVLPCLPYTDYLIVNELEAGKLAGMEPTAENLEPICRKLMGLGVRKKVIVHMPERAVCLSEAGFRCDGTYILPDGFIQGTTGAGDAFCAGALYSIYQGWDDRKLLEFANACAVMSLRSTGATGGLVTAEEAVAFCAQFSKRQA